MPIHQSLPLVTPARGPAKDAAAGWQSRKCYTVLQFLQITGICWYHRHIITLLRAESPPSPTLGMAIREGKRCPLGMANGRRVLPRCSQTHCEITVINGLEAVIYKHKCG